MRARSPVASSASMVVARATSDVSGVTVTGSSPSSEQLVEPPRQEPCAATGERDVACGGEPTHEQECDDDDPDEPERPEEGEDVRQAFERVRERVDHGEEVRVDVRRRLRPESG